MFNSRSPARPNPIGLHAVEISAIERGRIRVHHLEALNNAPILDLKPALSGIIAERWSVQDSFRKTLIEVRMPILDSQAADASNTRPRME